MFQLGMRRCGGVCAGDVLVQQVCGLHGGAPGLDGGPRAAALRGRLPRHQRLQPHHDHGLQRRLRRRPSWRPRLPPGVTPVLVVCVILDESSMYNAARVSRGLEERLPEHLQHPDAAKDDISGIAEV